MSKTKSAISLPVFRPKYWGSPSVGRELQRPWFGLDTERDAKDGRLVCCFVVKDSGEVFEFGRLMDFPAGTYWIYNLGYDIEGLVRDLGVEEGWAMKADGAPFVLGGRYRCRYFHGKRFEFTDKKGGRRVFLDASSFFGRISLAKASAAIGEAKNGGVVAAQMSLERYMEDREYREAVQKYCIQDAKICLDLILMLHEGCSAIGVGLKSTPGATARGFFARLGQFPEVLWTTHRSFLRAYCGGRFEITKRGVLEDVFKYDIVSAYPWALAQCPTLSHGAYHRFTTRVSDGALYGAYEISGRLDDYLGVIPTWKAGTRIYSKAEERVWISRPEIRYLMDRGADLTIHRGSEIFDEGATNLWGDVIKELFALKRERGGYPEGFGAKIVMNSAYGVLVQLVPKSGRWVPIMEAIAPIDFAGTLGLEAGPKAFEGGKYYAPAYAGHLTSLVRVKVLEAAGMVGSGAYIGSQTDGIFSQKPLPDRVIGKGLGDWKLEKTGDRLVICKTGQYSLDGDVTARGIHGTDEAGLYAPEHHRKIRISVKSAKNWEDVSLIVPKVVRNNLAFEMKRKWERDLDVELIRRNEFIDSEALEHVG